jgi:hypothetical protein
MTVRVEYSQASPGSSRLKGYGNTSSVLLDKFGLEIFVLLALLLLSAFSWGKKIRQ